jgi:uncharacterized protein (DUF58 family)
MLTLAETEQLHRLAVGGPAVPITASTGRRLARTRGFSVEFHDFRPYQPGDDLRSIDWKVDARLRQLVVRTGRGDGPVAIHVLLDTSLSMAIGAPDKLTCAKKLAAALSYLAVARRDPVGIATFDEALRVVAAPRAGRPQLFHVLEILEAVIAEGGSSIERPLVDYGNLTRGPGLVVVLSDFFHRSNTLDGLEYLLYRGLTPAIVQVVAEEELAPVIDGDVTLSDIEDPHGRTVHVDASALGTYLKAMCALSDGLSTFCAAHGIPWTRVSSSASFESLLAAALRTGLIDLHG